MTQFQEMLCKELRARGIRFVREAVLKNKLRVDVAVLDYNAIVEIHGPQHDAPLFGDRQLAKVIASDERRRVTFAGLGIRLIEVKLTDNPDYDRLLSATMEELLRDYPEPYSVVRK